MKMRMIAGIGVVVGVLSGAYYGVSMASTNAATHHTVPQPVKSAQAAEAAPTGPDFPVNSRGQTFGSLANAGSYESAPDLIAVYSSTGAAAYAKKGDFYGPMPKNPAEAIAIQEAQSRQGPRRMPLFTSEGDPAAGTFKFG